MQNFFRKKNTENVENKGKDKFSFADMHFDLGPAEKIFGPGGVRIRTQGTAELKIGVNMKSIDNPSLPIRNRRTTGFDFDEKINLSVNGRVGDKVNMNLNYNTDATFDFDTQNLKLKYEGKGASRRKAVRRPPPLSLMLPTTRKTATSSWHITSVSIMTMRWRTCPTS